MLAQWRDIYRLHARLPAFRRRVDRAKSIIADFLSRATRPYVAFSGGKDSTCLLLLLADLQRTDIAVLTQADDLDWPEKRDHCRLIVDSLGFRQWAYRESRISALAQFAALRPGGRIRGTFGHVIREWETEHGADGVMLGLRAEESRARSTMAKFKGALYRDTRGIWRACPLLDWTGLDVFALIVARNAPYMPLYDCPGKAPHEWRMSWPANPEFWDTGSAMALRETCPSHWGRLSALNSYLRAFS